MMPKRERLVEVDLFGDAISVKKPPNRKHKRHNKHKHNKHKKKKLKSDATADDDRESDTVDVTNNPSDDTVSSAAVLRADMNLTPPSASARNTPSAANLSPAAANALNGSATASAKRKRIRHNKAATSGTSSEEERWLDAIESGKLEQADGEMKKMKDPRLMTARQRAMYERSTAATTAAASAAANTAATSSTNAEVAAGVATLVEHSTDGQTEASQPFVGDERLVALPSGYKEIKVLSAEDIEKALVKSQKRKQLADEKREKNKRKTMERLLKKKDYKATAKANRARPTAAGVPMISWRSAADGTTITFPPGVEVPLMRPGAAAEPVAEAVGESKPEAVPCGRVPCAICGEPKRYSCSRTHVPLCSFECYKENVAGLRQIMC